MFYLFLLFGAINTNSKTFNLEKILITEEKINELCHQYSIKKSKIINAIFIYLFLKYFLNINDNSLKEENPNYKEEEILKHILFVSEKLSYLISAFFLKNKIYIPVNNLNIYEYCYIKGKYKKHKPLKWWYKIKEECKKSNILPANKNFINCNYEIKISSHPHIPPVVINEIDQEFSLLITNNQMKDFQILYEVEIIKFEKEMDAYKIIEFIKNSIHINKDIIINILINRNIKHQVFHQCLEFSKLDIHLQEILTQKNIHEPFIVENNIITIKKKIFYKYMNKNISKDLNDQIMNILLSAMKKKYDFKKLCYLLEKHEK
ncbi:hypothetical protein AB836_01455 [Rickettsiales bacterium (ex Bugula neritina AB1)]|nr:hypothetical protein AB836_01455 [Rickettsiales bacterium (ex Bugula neritina AB1)]